MGPLQRLARLLVPHGHLKLVQPDARIDGELLPAQGLELDRTGTGGDESPEALDTLRERRRVSARLGR